MKNRYLHYVLGLCLFLAGCAKIYHCEYSIPADMEEYVPDMKGMTYVYANASNDTTIELVGLELRIFPQTPIEWEDDGGGYDCSNERVIEFARPGDNRNFNNMVVYFLRSFDERFSSNYMKLQTGNIFDSDHGVNDVFCYLKATFDEQGHFVTRDFGDTLLLTDPRLENPDTALWVRGLGLIRLNDYHLVSVTDSTGDVFYSAEAK